MRFRQLKIQLQTNDGPYGVTLDFPDGLVAVWADNSMGKSTCVKSILVALGMEAMLTTTHTVLPLPPAVKTRLDSITGEHDVLESEVFLEIENTKGERIVVHRTIKGARNKNLITVYNGPALTSPGSPMQTMDFFVSRSGAATRELGFHRFLAKFFSWTLPLVQTYDGNEYPLYLQCIFPYFIVEQTRGWSTIQPPLPTQFRIRDAHKRAIEFLLDLDAHRVALKRQEIQFEYSRIESLWSAQIRRATDLAKRVAGTIQALPQKPVATWPPQVPPLLVVLVDTEWVTINQRITKRQAELDKLVQEEIPRVQEITSSAQAELTLAEMKVRDQQTLLSRLLDSFEMENQEVSRIEEHLSAIDEDIQKNKDVRTLKQLGSRQDSSLDNGTCPVCHQAIHDSLVPLIAEQAVMSLDENIQFLVEQRRTYEIVLSNARKIVESRTSQIHVLREELSSLRETVRILRQTLVSDGRLPSLAAIRARIELENAVRQDMETEEQFDKTLESFMELSQMWQSVQAEMQKLPKYDVTESDKNKINVWTQSLRDQLTKYGFGSFKVDHVKISPDTYRPEHEGFEMETSFSLQTSISASDLIRTIWSYLNGLLELSRTENNNHPGCIIFDEPRQQSTRDMSFSELLRRASTSGQFGQQVIFFTSENQERLKTHLSGLPHTFKPIEGRVLKKL